MKLSLVRRNGTLAVAAAGMLLVVACGGEKTDVSQGVKQINDTVLAPQGASLDCPKEIDGGEGTEFDCKLKGTESGQTADVKLKVTKQGDELAVDLADQAAFNEALATVTGGGAEAAPEEEVAPEEEAAPEGE